MKRIHMWIYSMAILAMTDVLFAAALTTNSDGFSSGTVSNGSAIGINRDLAESVERLGGEANRRGDLEVGERLASEVGVSADLLHEQRAEFEVDWGDLLIAYTLVEQSRSGVTVDRIFDMRDDGMSWFQIAKSLRVPPGRLMNLVRRGTSELMEMTIPRESGRQFDGKAVTKTRRADMKGSKSTKPSSKTGSALRANAKMAGTTKVTGSTMKMGGQSVSTMRPTTRMGGGIGVGSATRIHGTAGRGHGRR